MFAQDQEVRYQIGSITILIKKSNNGSPRPYAMLYSHGDSLCVLKEYISEEHNRLILEGMAEGPKELLQKLKEIRQTKLAQILEDYLREENDKAVCITS